MSEKTKTRFIALYLPQYHPIPENDEWWGKGFTEWTNVGRAKPLYRGHYQPKVPTDLGYYDLRLPEVRYQQAELARLAGIEGFCYYHYWFGEGKMLMERPFKEVVDSGEPDFPFCLCWANHSWYKKLWDPHAKGKNLLLIEQKYPGEQDYLDHFIYLLSAFRDSRYIRVNGKIFFIIYDAMKFSDVSNFIVFWRKLAKEYGLNDFYFVATDYDGRNKEVLLSKGFDATYNVDLDNIHHHLPVYKKALLYFQRKYLHRPAVFKYKNAIKHMIIDDCKDRRVIPVIGPNWDHTPRSGGFGLVLHDAQPKYFKEIAKRAIDIVKSKPEEERIVIIKSWNEWGEGNYMEPDIKYGHGYLEALKEAINESDL